ncbi:FimV/HubP family polar landmark protein [Aromatoleum evansii]|uniref:FimV/HubP family polar landmark protein n=1 Tax=Aromatoleum evansii TaxID=59406 RepID=UPI003BB5FA8F
MKTSIKASLIATAIAMLPFGSNAAGLGSIHVFSGIGQPLRAEVELNASNEELQSLSARVAPPEAFRQASLQYTVAISGLRFAVERRGSRSVVKITSDRPFNDPFVDLLIELNWASGRLVREYTFLLDPVPAGPAAPAVGRGAAPVAAPLGAPATSAQRKTPAVSPAPAVAQTAGGERHEIKKGDTLHRIAEANRPEGASLDQMLIALFRENPDAFEGNNINRLRTGSIVTVPSDARVREIDPVQARREVQAQSADFAAYRRKLAGAVAARPAAPESAPSRSDAGTIVPKVDEPARPAAGDQVKVSGAPAEQGAAKGADSARLARLQALEEELVARDKALQEANERVAALEASVKQMQELLNLRSESMAQLQQQASSAPAPAPAQEPAAAPAAPSQQPLAAEPQQAAPAKEEAPAPVATPKPAPAPKPAPEPVEEPGFVQGLLGDPAVLAGGGGILALLLAYAGIKARQRRKQDAGHAVESIASEFPPPTNSVFGATGGQSVNTGESSVLHTDFSQSGLSAIDTDEGVDPVAEADVYMAYGRDAQAEEILLDALKTDASRMAIYVKLLEIYAQRKNLKAFENTATDLYSRTGGEGGDWDKAAEMGRRLDPENPLYRATAGGGIPTAGLVAGAAAVASLATAGVHGGDSGSAPAASFETPASPTREPVPTEMPGDAGIEALPEVDAGALDFDLDAGLDFGSDAATAETPMPQIDAVPSVEAAQMREEAPSFDLDVGGVAEQVSKHEPVATPVADPMLATVIGQGMDFAAADQALEFDLASELDVAAAPAVGEVSLDQTMISPEGAPAAGGSGTAEDLEKTSFDSSLLDFDFNLDGGANQAAATPPALDLAGIDLNLEATSLASGAAAMDAGDAAAASAGGLAADADVIEEVTRSWSSRAPMRKWVTPRGQGSLSRRCCARDRPNSGRRRLVWLSDSADGRICFCADVVGPPQGGPFIFMHSGFLIALWMACVVVLQFLSPPALAVALAFCALAGWWLAPSRSLKLLRRVRFLILAILVLFAGFTPGEALLSGFPGLSPSREGVTLAAEHVGRLIAVVLCVAVLMEGLPVSRLVGGLHALLSPLGRVGLPTERLAVRLMLVLRYVESAPPASWREWLTSDGSGGNGTEKIVFARELLAWREWTLLLAMFVVAVLWFGVAR